MSKLPNMFGQIAKYICKYINLEIYLTKKILFLLKTITETENKEIDDTVPSWRKRYKFWVGGKDLDQIYLATFYPNISTHLSDRIQSCPKTGVESFICQILRGCRKFIWDIRLLHDLSEVCSFFLI